MEAYLSFISTGSLNIEGLIDQVYDIDNANLAYQALKKVDKPLALILQYPDREDKKNTTIECSKAAITKDSKLKVAIIGAGGFAKSTLLPILLELTQDYEIKTILTKNGYNSIKMAKEFNIPFATTDFSTILDDSEIDTVIIATRHNLHAEMVIASLTAGKNVFVEKPLCLNRDELSKIKQFYENNDSTNVPLLMCGFNRRFSPYIATIKSEIKDHISPMIINYRVNAGYIPIDSWVHGEEGGGRNIGEACHFYDVFTYLTNSKVNNLNAMSIKTSTAYYANNDNFSVNISFDDGTIASLTYTALGAKEFSKECMDVYVDGKIYSINDYQQLTVYGDALKPLTTKNMEKGHREELIAFADAIKNGKEWPIPLWQIIQATEISFDVQEKLNG
jgi:predicted dehydrogenase